jgi:SOS-response transcriptional repressor LexA
MEENILKIIKNFYKEKGYMPSIRFIQSKLNYKSVNYVYRIMNKLCEEGYLIHYKDTKKWVVADIDDTYIKVKALNEDDYLLIRQNKKKYTVYKIKNNNFLNRNILKDDYLIVEKTQKLDNNTLGLFIYNNNYHIMNYNYKDGFYILDDGVNKEYLCKLKIIGKVIGLQRKKVL